MANLKRNLVTLMSLIVTQCWSMHRDYSVVMRVLFNGSHSYGPTKARSHVAPGPAHIPYKSGYREPALVLCIAVQVGYP